MRLGVIGVGSNSVRLLVAEVRDGALQGLLRDRCGTRLFASLSETGLSQEGMQSACESVRDLARKAREAGAERVFGFATSAVRDAENREVFLELVRQEAGVSFEVITGGEEAVLAYLGAAGDGLCGVIDIGGGSTEITLGKGGAPLRGDSVQMGAVRLHERLPIEKAADVARAEQAASEALQKARLDFEETHGIASWVGVGGTCTTLAAMDKQLFSFDRKLVQGHEISYETARRWAEEVADMPLTARYRLPGLQPQRADIVVHGIAILMACMKTFGIAEIAVSDTGNLEGYLKRKMRGGEIA